MTVAGMQALGVSFKDVEHNEIKPGGAALNTIDKIDTSHLNPLLQNVEIKVALTLQTHYWVTKALL